MPPDQKDRAPPALARTAGAARSPGPTPDRRHTAHERSRHHGLNGRLGLRYYGLRDWTDYGRSISQPEVDLRLAGALSARIPLTIDVDVRSRRTTQRFNDGSSATDDRTRVYRLSTAWGGSNDPWRITAGRQSSTDLSSAGMFDGISGEYRIGRVRIGFLSGTQPDPKTNGISTRIVQHGAYVGFEQRSPDASRRSLTAGFLGSYRDGQLNRESFHLQSRYFTSSFSGSLMQDIDLNRGWKRAAGEKLLSPTGTLLMARYRFRRNVSISGGFDNRRMIRLYSESETQQTHFDDRYRQGLWTGVQAKVAHDHRVGLTLRLRTGGSGSSANTASAYGEARWPQHANLSIRVSSSVYSNHLVSGRMYAVQSRLDLISEIRSSLTWGMRPERSANGSRTQKTWIELELERSIGRACYLLVSGERSRGDEEDHLQIDASASYRF